MAISELLSTFDPADHLNSGQTIADFMSAAQEANDTASAAQALGVPARAKVMTEVAGLIRPARTVPSLVQRRGQSRPAPPLSVVEALWILLFAKQSEINSSQSCRLQDHTGARARDCAALSDERRTKSAKKQPDMLFENPTTMSS